ncbi:MAG TPA: transglutaminase family protein [Tepidisphaeraceae bacterium]|nr:transglutaminase family protein [Tepidisphaeraceae bacterium]
MGPGKHIGTGSTSQANDCHALKSLTQLIACSPAELNRQDIARVNLLCATDLPGSEELNIPQCLVTLDRWTEAVRRYTQDALGEFNAYPDRYHGHRGFASFTAMVTLLKHPKGLNIGYQASAIGNTLFSDSRDDLLHGLLTRRLGTCTSLPVLYVAIGRRLGYPMHLAVAKGHVLCQWVEVDGSHVNLEGSNAGGGELYPDEHYHHWPRPLTKEDLASGRCLRPLTRAEELGLFLETRGHVLTDNGRFEEAQKAYRDAHRVSGGWSPRDVHLSSLDYVRQQRAHRRLANSTDSSRMQSLVFPSITVIPG